MLRYFQPYIRSEHLVFIIVEELLVGYKKQVQQVRCAEVLVLIAILSGVPCSDTYSFWSYFFPLSDCT